MSLAPHTISTLLKKLDVPKHAPLLVHSAFKSFARDGYQAIPVLESLMDYMHLGTLLMPTMSWRYVKPDKPIFNELTTPSNTGILTELFRQHYAQYRSLHPTHSVAGLGTQAKDMLKTHDRCITPCGKESPFAQLVKHDGYILLMGVGIDCCTLIHHAEEMLAPEHYVRPTSDTETYQCQDRSGDIKTVKLRRHLFLARNYWQFQDQLAAAGRLKVGACDNSVCIAFSAKDLYECVAKRLNHQPKSIIATVGQRYRMM